MRCEPVTTYENELQTCRNICSMLIETFISLVKKCNIQITYLQHSNNVFATCAKSKSTMQHHTKTLATFFNDI
jgi:hypothetical protein